MNKCVFFLFFFTAFYFIAEAQDLTIAKDDLRIEFKAEGGFHLYIRKKEGIGSVLLTESTRDPQLITDNYAYRAGEWNPVNGDEIRIIDGKPIPRESGIYSLISSTPRVYPEFGQAFHIYIPYVLYYGYAEGRHGEVFVGDGTYLNIRAFSLPYADYRGAFLDNSFVMEASQVPPSDKAGGNFLPETVESFREIAKSGGGDLIYVNGTDELIERIRDALKKEAGKNVDMVICLDTTGSMKKYIDHVRGRLVPMMKELVGSFASWRIGMVLYKDYNEAYLTKIIPFTNDFAKFQKDIDDIRTGGGGDIPEAVYEALYTGAAIMPWILETKIMFLIGDAPAHPKPRGKITKALVDSAVAEKGIKVNAVILPQ
ncbi:MAG: VWA domain-containing protein [Treponema sp.]|nr:VWA domain-containing protein [Treponema sp.]